MTFIARIFYHEGATRNRIGIEFKSVFGLKSAFRLEIGGFERTFSTTK